jgi:guanylate kinase
MHQMVANQEFVEVKPVHNKVYGTSIAALEAPFTRGHTPVLDIDVRGAEEFVAAVPELRPIFLIPPSFSVWQQRLEGRGMMDKAEMRRRIANAVQEIEAIMQNPAFQLLVNADKHLTADIIRSGYIGRDHDAVDVADNLLADIEKWLQSNPSD